MADSLLTAEIEIQDGFSNALQRLSYGLDNARSKLERLHSKLSQPIFPRIEPIRGISSFPQQTITQTVKPIVAPSVNSIKPISIPTVASVSDSPEPSEVTSVPKPPKAVSISASAEPLISEAGKATRALKQTEERANSLGHTASRAFSGNDVSNMTSRVGILDDVSNRLKGTILSLGAAFATAFSAGQVIQTADAMQNVRSRLALINDGKQSVPELENNVYAAAIRARTDMGTMGQVITRVGMNAGNAFKSTREIESFSEILAKQYAIAGATPEEMLAAGTISNQEADKLKEVHHALKSFRIYLHLIAGRHEDRLIFDLQTALAQAAGYKDTEHQLASEALMKRYYLTAKSVRQLTDIFMQMFEDKFYDEGYVQETVIDRTFIARGYTLDITHEGAFRDDPNAILRAFYLLESSAPLKRLSVSLLRELMSARDLIDEQFRDDPANKAMFMQILKMPHGVSHALQDLNQWGILGLFLPEFQHIVGQMQHDLFHTYTVDQHTMRVVRNIRYFTRSEYAHEYPICTRLMQGMKDNWRLVLAALFHDIGKGLGGHHEKAGAKILQAFCDRFSIDQETTDYLVFLVREHLTMSLVAQKQDLSDPDVIKRFAQIVQTEDRLNGLFLLTVCDIRATGPKVWTQWKSQLLQDLYWQTLPLVRQGGAPDRESLLLQRQKEAGEMIVKAGVTPKKIEAIWKTLTLQYYLRHTAESIAWQTISLAKVFPTDEPFVATRILPQNAGIEILVYTPDRTGLFASILGFLQKKRFSVLDARIYTTLDHKAFNTFVVSDNGDRDIGELNEKLADELTEWLSNPRELPKTKPGKLSRRSRHFPLQPLVNIEADESGKNYLLSVTCMDRIGLLFDIATILNKYHVNLQTAKIMTMGERVEDVFLIDGEALKDIPTTVAIEKDLLEVLTPEL